MEHCGRSAGRWEALAAAMSFGYDEKTVSFDRLLDSLDHTPVRRRAS
ncbi:hypothetical protein SPW_0968 [Streptomyces sp. W007]|nr:hypothetical protein SPW_0968 [Streptomyces sp. W007]